MLEYVDKRLVPNQNKEAKGEKLPLLEKEREFFDCVRMIISNGYEINGDDVIDILRFIRLFEIFYFPEGD